MNKKGRNKKETSTLAEMLPELTERHCENARHETSIAWATELMANCRVGELHVFGELNVVLQKVNPYTIRVVKVSDDIADLFMIKMCSVCFPEIYVNFEMEQAIILQLTEDEKTWLAEQRRNV